MSEESKRPLDQLERSLLKFSPVLGGILGGLSGIAFIGDRAPPILGAVLGGAFGAMVLAALIKGAFAIINPKRRG